MNMDLVPPYWSPTQLSLESSHNTSPHWRVTLRDGPMGVLIIYQKGVVMSLIIIGIRGSQEIMDLRRG